MSLVVEYVLLAVLLLCALFIVVAVIFQKSGDEGLSGTIAGGNSETFYGKDKGARTDKALYKWTLIAAIVFALAVLVAYVFQPDYSMSYDYLDKWQEISEFSSIFK
jgi:preprotein translocase subunit SecG